MRTVHGIEVSQKVLLGEEEFIKYKRVNRIWYAILCAILVSIFCMISVGVYIGPLVFVYCIPLGVLASKNKSNPIKWVLFTILSTAVLGFIISHILITIKGFKHEWL
ncbi:hypothetical protein ACR30L_06340 [Psychromonas sp. PT13]|uniref:hypothetical protein n=1 Tax=Psychromonas sp. PT13 TaxID=3439547 RepID=UPI003EBA4E3F